MKPVRQQRVRALLRQYPQGMTAYEIADITKMHIANVRTALRAMPDVYVDRWQPAKRGQYEKVWCAAYVPENCPHPKDKKFKGGMGKPKTRWQPMVGIQ
jgi:hypothetical protein